MYQCTDVPMEQPNFERGFYSELFNVPMEQPNFDKNIIRSSHWGQLILARDDIPIKQPNNMLIFLMNLFNSTLKIYH